MDVDMPVEYIICGLADLLREEGLALLPVETLIILKNVLDQEISMGRTVH
jgi:hypothetical protein|tara:strand:- start:677 stop:826 length:150 start_codon:yes stop_codon:yes gene_type:complete